jgi:hypothetical protein
MSRFALVAVFIFTVALTASGCGGSSERLYSSVAEHGQSDRDAQPQPAACSTQQDIWQAVTEETLEQGESVVTFDVADQENACHSVDCFYFSTLDEANWTFESTEYAEEIRIVANPPPGDGEFRHYEAHVTLYELDGAGNRTEFATRRTMSSTIESGDPTRLSYRGIPAGTYEAVIDLETQSLPIAVFAEHRATAKKSRCDRSR